jgi:hypothetical protein
MIRALVIGDTERRQIREAVARAREHPLSLEEGTRLAVGTTGEVRDLRLEDRVGRVRSVEPQQVVVPFGYQCAVSFEEQPAGLCIHLSISVERAEYLPNPIAVKELVREFGIDLEQAHAWLEEYLPGQRAVNVVSIVEKRDGS